MSAGPRSGGTVAQFQKHLHHWDQTIRLRRLPSYPERAAVASNPSIPPCAPCFTRPSALSAARAEHSVAPGFARICGDSPRFWPNSLRNQPQTVRHANRQGLAEAEAAASETTRYSYDLPFALNLILSLSSRQLPRVSHPFKNRTGS